MTQLNQSALSNRSILDRKKKRRRRRRRWRTSGTTDTHRLTSHRHHLHHHAHFTFSCVFTHKQYKAFMCISSLVLKLFLEKYMRGKYSFFISSYALLMYWMQKKGVIDFSVNLYCRLSLEILSLSSTFYFFFFFIRKSSFFFWLRAENVSHLHTLTHMRT